MSDYVWISAGVGVGGLALGYVARLIMARYQASAVENATKSLLKNAKREAEAIRKEGKIHAKDEVIKARDEFESSTKDRRKELTELEQRINKRETNLDRKVSMLEKKERSLDERTAEMLREIALRGETEQWRNWARLQMLRYGYEATNVRGDE